MIAPRPCQINIPTMLLRRALGSSHCILVEKGKLDMDMRRLTLVTSNVSFMSQVLFTQKTTYVAGAFGRSGSSHRPPPARARAYRAPCAAPHLPPHVA
jgi:hypothetical protein